MPTIAVAILSSVVSSLFGLTAGFGLLAGRHWVRRISQYLVSFAVGAMLAAAFFDLLTEAIHEGGAEQTGLIFGWALAGFVVFFLIEKFLLWHHHTHEHHESEETPQLAKLVIAGDAIHNAIDGIIIGAAFLVSQSLGVATALAVLLHELPQEISDFSIMIHAGMKRHKIVWWNIAGSLVSPIATAATFWLAGQTTSIIVPLLGVAAGSFIYIAAADLVPNIHRERRLSRTAIQLLMMILGMLVIVAVGQLVHEG